jgi:predicted ATPase
VFLVRDLGFAERTDARRISFDESLEFERVHITTYRSLWTDLVDVPRGGVERRADLVEAAVASSV